MKAGPIEGCAGLTGMELKTFVEVVLGEDLGRGDATSDATIPPEARFSASLVPRQNLVVAGLELARAFFEKLDPQVSVEILASDGLEIEAGEVVMRLDGSARAMLSAERSALNTLQHLSGIATLTRKYVREIEGTGCTLLDTRKTIPGLRSLEKYAARMGGAVNHRMRLDDGILIKDNHIAAAGDIQSAVRAARAGARGLEVQVEVDLIEQIEPALSAGAQRLLCDNMSPDLLRQAVELVAGRVKIEASGGITLETIKDIALTGVDFVSVGRITQSAPAADIGLDYRLAS